MQTAIVSGLFAFIGSLIAVYLQQRVSRESWLLQKRAEVFSQFHLDFEKYEEECRKAEEEFGYDTLERSKRQSIAMGKLNISENIVCFYLSSTDRKTFRDLLSKRLKFSPDFSSIEGEMTPEKLRKCYEPLYDIETMMQNLFEDNLNINRTSVDNFY